MEKCEREEIDGLIERIERIERKLGLCRGHRYKDIGAVDGRVCIFCSHVEGTDDKNEF